MNSKTLKPKYPDMYAGSEAGQKKTKQTEQRILSEHETKTATNHVTQPNWQKLCMCTKPVEVALLFSGCRFSVGCELIRPYKRIRNWFSVCQPK